MDGWGRGLLVAIATISTAPAAWAVGGLIDDGEVGALDDPDHLWPPIDALENARPLIGALSIALTAIALAILLTGTRGAARRQAWLLLVLPLGAIAAYAGFTYAAGTAPVVGANIGAALLVFGAVPFAIAMVVATFAAVANLRRVEGRDPALAG